MRKLIFIVEIIKEIKFIEIWIRRIVTYCYYY
jgi:hypothetical protein